MTQVSSPRVLVCPLDWGLGHAARCVPVIKALQNSGFEVAVATGGGQASLIQKELPGISCFPLPGYDIHYSSYLPLVVGLILQSPSHVSRYFKARKHFLRIVRSYRPSVIISDNRPECFWEKAFNVYITHQLSVYLGGSGFLEKILSHIHAKAARYFHQVWVPDMPEYPGLSGRLGHPAHSYFRQSIVYVGLLSRFTSLSPAQSVLYDVCFTLSGPEPARSLWEIKIITQGKAHPDKKFALIRGTQSPLALKPSENFLIINQAASKEIQYIWAQSRRLVCRAGYTTLMDLWAAGRAAWIVPTPGQTEQEYLANLHRNSGRFFSLREEDFSIDAILSKELSEPSEFTVKNEWLSAAVEALLEKVASGGA